MARRPHVGVVPATPGAPPASLLLALLLTALLSLSDVRAAHGDEGDEARPPPEFIPLEDWSADDGLSGDAIYDCMLENRFQSYEQELALRSGDRSGKHQEVQLRLRYMNLRHEGKRILSKTIAKYFAPTDVRHLGYLVINKRDLPDDQFIYRPSARKVRRINVRGEAVVGTDFAFEDVVPQEFEDGRHYRLPDDRLHERDTWMVAVVPLPHAESEYSKFTLHIEQEHCVPLRTVYWDNKRVKIKQLDVEPESIARFEDVEDGAPKTVWIATRSRMRHLKMQSYTELHIERLVANPGLRARDFSERELTASR